MILHFVTLLSSMCLTTSPTDIILIDLDEWGSSHHVTAVVKLWFRELPEGLITLSQQQGFVDATSKPFEVLKEIQEAKILPHSYYFLGHIMLSWQSVTASRVECNVRPKPRHRIRTITRRPNDNPYKRGDGRCKPNFGEWSTTCVPRNPNLIASLYRLYRQCWIIT